MFSQGQIIFGYKGTIWVLLAFVSFLLLLLAIKFFVKG